MDPIQRRINQLEQEAENAQKILFQNFENISILDFATNEVKSLSQGIINDPSAFFESTDTLLRNTLDDKNPLRQLFKHLQSIKKVVEILLR